MVLDGCHPGVTLKEIEAETGWPLRRASSIAETPPPNAAELAAVRKYDPKGVWTA